MSYQLNFVATFPVAGLTLNAKLYDAAASQVGSTITSGFVDHGDRSYSYLATIPNGHVGTFVVYDSTQPTTRAVRFSINPQEAENSASILTGVNSLIATIGTAGAGLTALPGMVWANITRTLTSGGGATAVDVASAVWSYSRRLLTAGGVQVEEDSDTQDFSLKQGEYKQITIAVTDNINAPVNLTGYTLDWGLWRGATRLLTKSLGSGITLVNVAGTNDGLRITLSANDTRTLAPGTYYHECRVTNASSEPEVVAAGDVAISESKTA